jgi:hypothetical protein
MLVKDEKLFVLTLHGTVKIHIVLNCAAVSGTCTCFTASLHSGAVVNARNVQIYECAELFICCPSVRMTVLHPLIDGLLPTSLSRRPVCERLW